MAFVKELQKIKVTNMPSHRGGEDGDKVANQFVITIGTKKGTKRIFQSYGTIIAIKDEEGFVTLDRENWNYSPTTSKYRNDFLCERTAETRRKIKNGIYMLADLN